MGRKKTGKVLNVFLNGASVGLLKKDSSGQISFKYGEEWIQEGFAISQSLPIQEQEYKGEIVSRYFDNLLPDNDEIKKLVAQKFGAESTRPFDILEVVGRDCVGALTFIAEDGGEPPIFEMNYSKLTTKKIANKIRGLGSVTPLGMEEKDFRLSIAGAQEKTVTLTTNTENGHETFLKLTVQANCRKRAKNVESLMTERYVRRRIMKNVSMIQRPQVTHYCC
jgi:serine/threonine-protein kinase HipA